MKKIIVKATKLQVKDRVKLAGVTYKITNLQKSFGHPKSKNAPKWTRSVHVTCLAKNDDGTRDYQRINFEHDALLTARRK